ncbi:DUF5719 family protein [Microbacterium sp. 2FI]|uniref:DUF5719 family protein n=1 Tax=Microbacterium sp. 2FI TaxID=2502193 RepID=UPI0010F44A12|nr:DUF5719 family protein [Microbacterium sp. 2FI]
MSDRRVFRWATTSARLLAGTVVSALAVVAVVTAVTVPWPTLSREPVAVSAVPAPAESVIACDGGLLTLGRDLTDAAAVALAAPQSVYSGVADGVPEPAEARLAVPQVFGGSGPVVFTSQPQGRSRTDVAASGSATASDDDLAGFAASACRPPLMESWLVGGSAATGAADLVLLSNPGTVAATVQLTVFGAAGEQTPPGGTDVIVAAGTQRIIPLAGLVLGEESPVVRISAIGAPVHAALQTSITRTLTPGGVDQVGAITEPEQNQVITGVTVTRRSGADGASDAATVLRLLSPSADAAATITVTAVGRGDPALSPVSLSLVAGEPAELDLGGLLIGTYTVEVIADAPVVSAVWQTTGFDEGDDFAWFTPAPIVDAPSLFATTAGPPPVLTVVNSGDAAATVAITSNDGSFRLELAVPPGGSAIGRLSPRTVYLLDSGGAAVRAGLSVSGDGALAGFPVWPADAAAPAIVVYP